MDVRLTKSHWGKPSGTVLNLDDETARALIERGDAEPISSQQTGAPRVAVFGRGRTRSYPDETAQPSPSSTAAPANTRPPAEPVVVISLDSLREQFERAREEERIGGDFRALCEKLREMGWISKVPEFSTGPVEAEVDAKYGLRSMEEWAGARLRLMIGVPPGLRVPGRAEGNLGKLGFEQGAGPDGRKVVRKILARCGEVAAWLEAE